MKNRPTQITHIYADGNYVGFYQDPVVIDVRFADKHGDHCLIKKIYIFKDGSVKVLREDVE